MEVFFNHDPRGWVGATVWETVFTCAIVENTLKISFSQEPMVPKTSKIDKRFQTQFRCKFI
jgi:hypothetical protein